MKKIISRDLQKYFYFIPDFTPGDEIRKKIHSMDVQTAYVLLGGVLAPLLNKPGGLSTGPPPFLPLQSPFHSSTMSAGTLPPYKSPQLREDGTIQKLEKQLREILTTFKEYAKMDLTGEEDKRGKLKTTNGEVNAKYKELYKKIQVLREIINKEEKINKTKEVIKKLKELLVLFFKIQESGATIGGSNPTIFVVITSEEAKERIKDIEKALQGIYETRNEREEREIKELEDRLEKLTKDKDLTIGNLKNKIKDLEGNEEKLTSRIANLEKKLAI